MDKKLSTQLGQEEISPFHQAILKDCKALVDMSRKKMGTFYDKWDHNIDVFNGLVKGDKDDQAARERKEPEKMVVPIGYSQIMTFCAFCFSLYTQRERMFELLGMNKESHESAKIGEAFIARDLNSNVFEPKLFQFLLDVSRCSLGVFKIHWVHEKQMVRQQVEIPGLPSYGLPSSPVMTEQLVETTKYLGNRISNVSPYRFFPDVRLPLSRFQEGEFCASEDEYSYVTLKQLEHEGVVFGIDHIKSFNEKEWKDRGTSRVSDDFTGITKAGFTTGSNGQSKGTVLVTEIQRVLIPSKYMVDDKPLGPEDYPVKYLIWYANDNRVIRCEPLNYIHNEFTYSLGEYTSDQANLINMSLSDSIDMLQSVISWFINSHITSVRKVISNFLIVDPNGIEMQDLKDRKPVIRLKATAAGGIDRYVKQLNVNDVTQNHLTDVDVLQSLIQVTTGISENLLGQFHPGRRSATEARAVNSGAVGRLKMQASIIYKTALEPMAKQMLSNLRDGLDEQTMVRLIGIDPTVQHGSEFAKVDKTALVGDVEFEIFDGTLPSEKQFTAQALQDFLTPFVANPQAAIALQIDPRAMLMDAMELRGIRNPERYTLQAAPQQPQDPNAQPGNDLQGGPVAGIQSPGLESLFPPSDEASAG